VPVAECEKLLEALRREPWDCSPRPWRTFWAVKAAAMVVESDAAAQSVRILPVESLGLSLPASPEEARRRATTNLVVFRQNYAVAGLAAALLGATRHAALLVLLGGLVVAAICCSDRLLGELSLATNGGLVWNAQRIAGLDRASTMRVALVAAAACFACMPYLSLLWLSQAAWMLFVFAGLHAITRPVDLASGLASFWSDVKSAKTREEVGRSFADAAQALGGWWSGTRKEPPVPVVVVQKGVSPNGGMGWSQDGVKLPKLPPAAD